MINHFNNISYLMIEVNSSCNLKCKFCNREDLKKKGLRNQKNLTEIELRQRLDKFKYCPIDTIKLVGLSEPMLHPCFHRMAEVLKEYFPKAFVIIATNLIYDIEKTSFIETLPHVDMVYLSIDGVGSVFEEQRLGASYKKFTSSLEKIKKNIPKKIRSTKLHLNFTATESNFESLPAVYKLKELYDLASVRINLAQNWSEDLLNDHNFSSKLISTLQEYSEDVRGVPDWNYQNCFWPYQGIVLDVFGNIRQCLLNTSQDPLANINTSDLEDVYNSGSHYSNIRKQLSKNQAPSSCKTCDYNHLKPYLKKIFAKNQNAKSSYIGK